MDVMWYTMGYMRCDIITLFPEIVETYATMSILGRAQRAGVVTFYAHDLRSYANDKHHTVDDTPYGGGAGMVLKVAPIDRAVQDVRSLCNCEEEDKKSRVIVLSAKGKRYTQRDAERLRQYKQLILICGRYEGVDERVAEYIADEELSIGDYVLTGGELGALVIADSVARLVPGVLGNDTSAVYESHVTDGYMEHPHYTKPAVYKGWAVPPVLLSGDHDAIAQWRTIHAGNVQNRENMQ